MVKWKLYVAIKESHLQGLRNKLRILCMSPSVMHIIYNMSGRFLDGHIQSFLCSSTPAL